MVLRRRPLPLLILCCVLLSGSAYAGTPVHASAAGPGAPPALTAAPASPTAQAPTATAAVSATASMTPAQATTPTAPIIATQAATASSAAPIATTSTATPVTAALTATQATSQTIPPTTTAALTPMESATAGAGGMAATPTLTPTAPLTATLPATATAPALPTGAAPLTAADTGAGTPPTATVATLNAAAGVTATTAYGHLPLSFEPNQGQVDPSVQFLAHGPGFTLFLTGADATLVLVKPRARRPRRPFGRGHDLLNTAALTETAPISVSVLRLRYAGANPHPQVIGEDQLPGIVNYFVGHDASTWHTNIPTYAKAVYKEVYPGVDLVYYGTPGHLEYDWQIAAGADPRAITLAPEGARGLAIDGQGNLALPTGSGTVTQRAPIAYQDVAGQRHTVPVSYTLTAAGQIGFALGAYDHSQPLVIDPVLSYSTYLGGSGADTGDDIAVDQGGNAYVSGTTSSTNFPTSAGWQGALAGGSDAFVSKLNASGSALVYSTYLGGSNSDSAMRVAVDQTGSAYVVGDTSSTNFPTVNAFQGSYGGGSNDTFATKLNASGNALVYSTYFGGNGSDYGSGIAVDQGGDAYIAGSTSSTNLPIASPLQGSFGGGLYDGFVAKLSADGASVAYSTYLGGSGDDFGDDVAVDRLGDAYVSGNTSSTNFPLANAFQSSLASNDDAFVSKLNANGTSLVYSTYLGGNSTDEAEAIAVDQGGDAYATGYTYSTDFPTANAVQPAHSNDHGDEDAFVSKLNASGSALVYSTYLGGSSNDEATSIAVDPAGDAYIGGDIYSTDFPTVNAVQPAHGSDNGNTDAFVTKLNTRGDALVYSTYLGGNGEDVGYGIAADPAGDAYVTGQTNSTDFPTIANTLQPSAQGNNDAFVTKIVGAASGRIPWHPQSVDGGLGAIGDGVDVGVDLADGHADVTLHDLTIPGRGPNLELARVWDSALAQAAPGTAGLVSSLTPAMGGVLTQTVCYTDSSGVVWTFPYSGSITAPAPYTSYQTPAGQPWQLTTSTAGYTLTDFLTSETWRFDAQGRLLSDTDAYGNSNTLAQGASGPTQEANSGGRSLTFGYTNGALTDAQSPLWRSTNGAQGQHVTYGYNGSGQLTTRTLGAGTGDALTTTFGYSGTQLTTLTTPANRTWTLGYDGQGRVVSVSSPASGTVGQPGYTPSYTTQYTYGLTQTTEVVGAGTSGALITTYTLDAQGEPITVTDGLGHSSGSTYDADHDVTSSTDAEGHTTNNYYQYVGPTASVGLITQTVQPAIQPYSPINGLQISPVITHTYDLTTYDLLATGQPEGGLTKYTYDGHHSVVATTEQTTQNTCATACPVTWRGTINGYDQYGELTSVTDGRGVSVDGSGHATLNDPGGLYTRHQGYDTQGDLTSEGTPPITTTLNNVTKTAPVTTTYGNDGDGDQTSVQSANGNTTSYGYDHLGRQVSATLPAVKLYTGATTNPVETTGYDKDGHVARSADADGDVTTSSYDPLGREVSTTNPVSGTTIITYNATEQTAIQDPQGNVMGYGYDAVGRVISQANPVTGTLQYAYDAAGNTTALTTTDRTTGGTTTVEQLGYDALDRVITDTVVTNTANIAGSALTTLTRYDLDGNVAQTQQPTGDVVYNLYDAADQLTNVEIDPGPPLSKAAAATHPKYESYAYDGAGNQTQATDADNRLTTSQYDGDNRAVQSVAVTTPPTGTTTITTTMGYDPDGNALTQTTQTADSASPGIIQTHTVTDTYNAADWDMATGDDGYATGYGYDAAGQERSETIVDGATPVTMQLDAEGRVTSLSEGYGGAGPYTSQFGYNADDLPTSWTRPGGVSEQAGYDANSELTSLVATGPNTGSPATTLNTTYGYGYNAAGWTTSTTTISGTDTITHDGAGRITTDCGPQVIVRNTPDHCYRWAYDNNGNVTSQVADNGATEIYSYSPTQPNAVVHATYQQANVPASDQYKNTDTYYAYDGHGDTTAITSPVNGGYSDPAAIDDRFVYDAQERPITITHLEGGIPVTISLGYNAEGLRSRYTVAMSGTVIDDERFQYRDGELAQVSAVTATLNANGTVKVQGAPYTDTFIYGPAGELVEFLRQQNGQTNRYWYALDGQGSVVAVTDASGKVVDRYNYDSWGEQVGTYAEAVPQQLRYDGYWYDSELEWYWLTTRYYNPEDLRFMQPDPSDLDGVHTYTYVDDDPLDFDDPWGLAFPTCGYAIESTFIGCPNSGEAFAAAYQFFIGGYVDTIRTNPDLKAKAFAAGMLILSFVPATRILRVAALAPKAVAMLLRTSSKAADARLPEAIIKRVVPVLTRGRLLVRQAEGFIRFRELLLHLTPANRQALASYLRLAQTQSGRRAINAGIDNSHFRQFWGASSTAGAAGARRAINDLSIKGNPTYLTTDELLRYAALAMNAIGRGADTQETQVIRLEAIVRVMEMREGQ